MQQTFAQLLHEMGTISDATPDVDVERWRNECAPHFTTKGAHPLELATAPKVAGLLYSGWLAEWQANAPVYLAFRYAQVAKEHREILSRR